MVRFRVLLAGTAATLVAACATAPPPPPPATVSIARLYEQPAERAFLNAMRLYEDGQYERAETTFRRALSDMLAEYHYDQITAILKQRGMGHYGESHEGGRAFVGDGMEAKRTNDVPMSAMWTQRPGVDADQPRFNADIRESASVAHLYGKTYVAAESMTAGSNASVSASGPPAMPMGVTLIRRAGRASPSSVRHW